jgi:hypothetical protein
MGTGVPVPASAEVCVAMLLATDRLPVNVAAETGVKVTEMVQDPAAARVAPQVLVWAKSVGLAPVRLMAMPVSVAVPGFESVKVWAAEVAATVVEAKVKVLGVRTA